jgi:hypothetical protein
MMTRNNMQKDLFALLPKLIVESDDDTRFRFQAQQEALDELRCTQPPLGEWIDRCDYSFLMNTLSLSDRLFAKEFPGVQLSVEERKQFAEELSRHCDDCARCHLKKMYDLQWESCVDRAIAENREEIGKAIGYAVGKK